MLMYVVAERHVAMVTEIDWTNAWLMTTFPKHGAIKLHSVVCQSGQTQHHPLLVHVTPFSLASLGRCLRRKQLQRSTLRETSMKTSAEIVSVTLISAHAEKI